ncbi:MAG: hypothetical protein MI864_13620 [Pseudomonadales bacterium]|uniref:Uncharacterized protein n=1 Tax=Oleiphilus messinensis TaxID=141451 RepID=A0A1Y0I6S5_9GAMM|nr:hypothetical protein [Oleiphilus messinensis]ARU56197.1 hypothetical protein OLMES_2124 [Oleiphilus messinensis]MCG8611564.1 hypothetical protein [Pseudomonadales bacterium]
MDHENKISEAPHSTPTSRGVSRRNLVKGLAASSVVVSVASRPVWGQGPCSISGLLSGNLSRPLESYSCTAGGEGQTPGFWMNHPECWPTGYYPGYTNDPRGIPGTIFSSEFGTGSSFGITFMDVLDPQACENGAGSLEFHLIAALLNAAHPSVNYGKSIQEIKDAFNYVLYVDPTKYDILHDILANLNERTHIDAKALEVNPGWADLTKQKNITCN